MTIAAIAETGREGAMIEHIFETELVEIFGGDARFYLGDHQIERLGGNAACAAHAFEIFGTVADHRHARTARQFNGFAVNEAVERDTEQGFSHWNYA